MHVLGRRDGQGPAGRLGNYRARDGSVGSAVGVDFDRPHVGLVVGKRGSGKSYTLGVLAEGAARAPGVAPVVVDPMGAFTGLAGPASDAAVPATVIERPTVRADAIPPRSWPALLGLTATDPAGALVWRAASECGTLPAMRRFVADADAARAARRAAENHFRLAASWGVFDADGLCPTALCSAEATVLDVSDYAPEPMNAVVSAVARGLYEARLDGAVERLPWLAVDEVHTFFDGVAAAALETLLTRGRAPGVTLFTATQRPSALPPVAVSQADLRISHRLTSGADIEALARSDPTYLGDSVARRLPTERGCALVVDDATEAAHEVRVRQRATPHGGASPRASAVETVERGWAAHDRA